MIQPGHWVRWDDDQPRIQLEPNGKRGYMELRAVKKVQL